MKTKRILCLQHVDFEGAGSIANWAKTRGIPMEHACVPKGGLEKAWLGEQDLLLIMGGPMGVYEEEQHPWLTEEIGFIKDAIDQRRNVLGICLGSQLIARALGARVAPHAHKEVGWFQVRKSDDHAHPFSNALPDYLMSFHWHGDRFELPEDVSHSGSSEATDNQGFTYQEHVVALQHHLEVTEADIHRWLAHHAALPKGPYVQNETALFAEPHRFEEMQKHLWAALDAWLL
ncbi:hypothetical protein GC177_02340 [bacterium]|nr:hypothetical protein [bacterium]